MMISGYDLVQLSHVTISSHPTGSVGVHMKILFSFVDPIIIREDEFEVPYPNMDLRKAALKRLLKWLCDPLRGGNFLLIHDLFFREGLSAFSEVAVQTCLTINRLGAVINISSRLIRDKPRQSVQALCNQLGRKFPPYRRVLAETLMDTPTILNKRDFFYLLLRLVIVPWNKLRISHPQYIVTPVVIFLNWCLDSYARDCHINSYLRDLLWLIAEDRLAGGRPSLLWIMSGYWDLLPISAMFWQDPLQCQHIRELIGNDEAVQYTEHGSGAYPPNLLLSRMDT
ncbi:hypothetical protein D9756_010006 [Leucocoprinus leucothites]|uniref:Uncharacterized protein n=1 Tax=Leucocoprinus leucothites TaxID=201217 RepID=A0A8H5CS10_9AGAR|nr:hypothetical protein D9756_010006 [Leucoagaricus leucothites]